MVAKISLFWDLFYSCKKVFSSKSANKHMDWIVAVFNGKKEMVMADPKVPDKVMHAAMQVFSFLVFLRSSHDER
jgi:uncharacterized glyoxalase superfamily protein PhnB